MKIVVVGLEYIGLGNEGLLSQHNEAVGVNIAQYRGDKLQAQRPPIIDEYLSPHPNREISYTK